MVHLCILWNQKVSFHKGGHFGCSTAEQTIQTKKTKNHPQVKKLITPSQVGGEMSLFDLGRYAGKAGKKAAEMGRFFASEWLREPGAQKMLIGKAEPFLRKGIDQLSTAIRPKKAYKTNRKDLDGAGVNVFDLLYGPNYAPWTRPTGKGVDIHKAIGNFQNQKVVSRFPGITTQDLTTHWRNSYVMIQPLEKFLSFM